MSVWGIKQGLHFTPHEIVRETAKFVFYQDGCERRSQKINRVAVTAYDPQGFLPWRGNEADARKLAERLQSVKAEKNARIKAAQEYMRRECAKLLGESE